MHSVLVLVLSLVPHIVWCQSDQWKAFKNWNEGTSLVAESDSIVWVGTPVGLVRWNTHLRLYETFDQTNGLQFTDIRALAMDRKKQLWIATGQGLVKCADRTFTHYSFINSPLPNAGLTAITIDSADRVFVGMEAYIESQQWKNGGFISYDETSWRIVNLPADGGIGPPWTIAVYHDTVWISGFGDWNDLYVYTQGNLTKAPQWSGGGASSIIVDSQDALWVFSQRNLWKYSSGNWNKVFDADSEHAGTPWSKLAWDPRGGLWLIGHNPPYRLDLNDRASGTRQCGSWMPAGICPVQGIAEAFQAHFARSTALQFFVSEDGLFSFNGSRWDNYTIPKTINDNRVTGLATSPSGEIIISTSKSTQQTDGRNWIKLSGELNGIRSGNNDLRFAPNGTIFANHGSIYPNADSYSGFVTGLDFDGFGNLWATYPLMRFSWPSLARTTFTPEDMGIQTPSNKFRPQFMDVIVDKFERVWAAAWYYGAVMFDGKVWHTFPQSNSTLPNSGYDYVYADTKGRVWFAKNQGSPNYGFTVFDGREWRTYSSPQRYQISYVYQIGEDHFGNLWMATGGGLLRFDETSWTIFDKENSFLNTNQISAVTVDRRGNVWIGTPSGLYIYNPSGVDLSIWSMESPVDSIKATRLDLGVRVQFKPKTPAGRVWRYELERGRMTHKFWSIGTLTSPFSEESLLAIVDSTGTVGDCYYRIKEISLEGKVRYSELQTLPKLPQDFFVSSNYPNPFNSNTSFNIRVPSRSILRIRFYDILGRQITTPFQKPLDQGYHKVVIEFSGHAAGIYFYTAEIGKYKKTGKVLYVK